MRHAARAYQRRAYELCAALIAVCSIAFAANAADVSGRIRLADTRAPAAGASITLTCGDTVYESAQASANGAYRLRAPQHAPTGAQQCSLLVRYRDKDSIRIPVYTTRDVLTLNLELRDGTRWSISQK